MGWYVTLCQQRGATSRLSLCVRRALPQVLPKPFIARGSWQHKDRRQIRDDRLKATWESPTLGRELMNPDWTVGIKLGRDRSGGFLGAGHGAPARQPGRRRAI